MYTRNSFILKTKQQFNFFKCLKKLIYSVINKGDIKYLEDLVELKKGMRLKEQLFKNKNVFKMTLKNFPNQKQKQSTKQLKNLLKSRKLQLQQLKILLKNFQELVTL